MSTMRSTAALCAALGLPGCLLTSGDDDGGGGQPTSGNADDDGTGDPTSTSGNAPATTAMPGSTGDDGASGDDAVDDTGAPPPTDCSSARLLLGNPYFQGDLVGANPQGHGLRDDPPLRSRHLADVGGRLAVETQTEVWIADDTQLVRVAGNEVSEADRYRPIGTCAQARFLEIEGMAALPDGRVIVADAFGNGLVELSDPLADDCMAAPIAGNPDTTLLEDIDGIAAMGDIDGPGSAARFAGVRLPVADDAGNIYVIDAGNGKIKRIADDADRTVTTLYQIPDGNPLAMTFLDGTLYVTGSVGVDDAVWAIDAVAGGGETLFIGAGLFPTVIDEDDPVLMLSLTNDGVDLIVGSHEGYVLRMSTAATSKGAIAGYGPVIDFPSDLDLAASIPVGELPIDSYAIAEGGLLWRDGEILVANLANGTGYHVWAIECG